ncbi:hypothetical protein D3C71_1401410 [compost metagenome]
MCYCSIQREQQLISLKTHQHEIIVEHWMIDEVRNLDKLGVRILLCSYNFKSLRKYYFIDKISRQIVLDAGYYIIKSIGNVEIISKKSGYSESIF